MVDDSAMVSYGAIEQRILIIRGQKVMLDRDLAALYGTPVKALKQAVRRNIERFPDDFMFVLTEEEFAQWRSQFVTSKADQMGLRYAPMAFTEFGVAMLSSVLNSPQAILANIRIMRAFGHMRRALETHRVLARKLDELETKVGTHDEELRLIFQALKRLMAEPAKKKKAIGFGAKEAKGKYKK
jgi:hypothetical protein